MFRNKIILIIHTTIFIVTKASNETHSQAEISENPVEQNEKEGQLNKTEKHTELPGEYNCFKTTIIIFVFWQMEIT